MENEREIAGRVIYENFDTPQIRRERATTEIDKSIQAFDQVLAVLTDTKSSETASKFTRYRRNLIGVYGADVYFSDGLINAYHVEHEEEHGMIVLLSREYYAGFGFNLPNLNKPGVDETLEVVKEAVETVDLLLSSNAKFMDSDRRASYLARLINKK